jgi:hypothetical protein
MLMFYARSAVGSSDDDGPFGKEMDCSIRGLALRHVQKVLPAGSEGIGHAFDALELASRCNATPPVHHSIPSTLPSTITANANTTATLLFVDYKQGKDAAVGAITTPLKTISEALRRVARNHPSMHNIVLRRGTHFLNATLQITPHHSGLSISSYCSTTTECEEVWVSGGVQVRPTTPWVAADLTNGRNIWKVAVGAEEARAGSIRQSALHWRDDGEGRTALTRARWCVGLTTPL